MAHLDDEAVSLLALGEHSGTEADEHLGSCRVCHERLAELREVVDIGRVLDDDDLRPSAPPAAVWDRIAEEICAGETTLPVDSTPGSVVPFRRPSAASLAAALGVAAVLIAVAVFVVLSLTAGPSTTVVDSVALEPLAGSGVGRAELVREDGRRELRVKTTGLTARDGAYYELWLMDDEVQQLVSLGPIEPDRRGVFVVPEGLDIGRLRVVDVSVEPLDGVPTHSGQSVLRGTLSV